MPQRNLNGNIQLDPLEYEITRRIRLAGSLTRNDLADMLDISRSKLTKSASALIDRNILIDGSMAESTGGRRASELDLNRDFGCVAGIHMGASRASLVIADFGGEIITTHQQPIDIKRRPEAVMQGLFEQVQGMLAACAINEESLRAVAIGVPAPVDKDTQNIISPATMIGWEHFSLVDSCHQYFPDVVVQVDNDMSQMAMGELRYGLGRDHDNFIVVKIGTGIGCGIVVNGEIFMGNGFAGHIGHVSVDRNGPVCRCGNSGCLERFASGLAIAERAKEAVHKNLSPALNEIMEQNGGILTAEDVGRAATNGDQFSNDLIVECGQVIGKVLATIVSFFNPGVVILNGGVSNIGPQFLVSIHRTILEYSLPLSTQHFNIYKSELGHQAGMRGAVSLALENIFIPT